MLRQPSAVAAAALVLAVYAAVLSAMPKEGFWSPDEGAKFIQLHTVSWRGGWQYAIPYGGQHLDPDFAFYPTRCRFEDLYPAPLAGGGVKFHWPIWFPLGSGLLASVLGPTGLYVVPLLSGWLVALLAGHLMRAWEARLAPLAILAVGFATPVAFFSFTFWEHTLATLLALAALAIVASEYRQRAATPWLTVPLLLAAAALRIEMLLFAAAVACAWMVAGRMAPGTAALDGVPRGRRRALLIALGLALTVALVLLFGHALPERHRWLLSALPESLRSAVGKLPYLVEMLTAVLVDAPGNQSPVVPQLLRYGVLAACCGVALAALLRSWRAEAIVLLTALAAIVEFSIYLVVRPGAFISLHGFLPIAPVIVLAPYVLVPAWRQRQHAHVAIVVTAAAYAILAFAVIVVVVARADGVVPTGLEWGNRYLFTLYPLGVVLALAALHEYRRSARPPLLRQVVSAAAGALLLCGLLLQVRGVWMLVETRRLVTTWQASLHDGPPVMTDVWWLPAVMAPLFISHEVHCVRHTDDLATWFPVALAHGVDTFTFASFQTLDASQIHHDGFSVESGPEQVVSGLHLRRVRIAPAAAAP